MESVIKCLYKDQSTCLHEQWFQNLFGMYCFLFTIHLYFLLLICPFDRHTWFWNYSGLLPLLTTSIFFDKSDQLLKCLRILLAQTSTWATRLLQNWIYKITIEWIVAAWIEEIIIKSKEYNRQFRREIATPGITV